MARKKKRKPKTMGEMTNSRSKWFMNPVTRIKQSKKKYNRKHQKNNTKNMEDLT